MQKETSKGCQADGNFDSERIVDNLIKRTNSDELQWNVYGYYEGPEGCVTKNRKPAIDLVKYEQGFIHHRSYWVLQILGRKISTDQELLSRLKTAIDHQRNRDLKKIDDEVSGAISELEK
jgi:hypothetical protein